MRHLGYNIWTTPRLGSWGIDAQRLWLTPQRFPWYIAVLVGCEITPASCP